MIVLWILLGLVLLIVLALCIPVHARVGYGETLSLEVRYLFIKLKLLPAPEKPEEEKKPAPEKKPEGETQEKKPNPIVEQAKKYMKLEGFGGFMQLVGDLLKLTGTKAVCIIRKIRLRAFDLYVMTGADDAAEAAILYGKVTAAVYPAAEALFTLTKCKKNRRVSVDLDYDVKTPYAKLDADVSIRPIVVVHYGLQYLIGLLPIYKRFQNPRRRKTIHKKENHHG